VVVVCGPINVADNQKDTVTNPTLLIEVLSDSSENYDRGLKMRNYLKIESLQEYVLVGQSDAFVESYRRHDGQWILTAYEGLEAICKLQSVEVEIPLADIYRRIAFVDDQARVAQP
jgi:Uma2 family endonuclease